MAQHRCFPTRSFVFWHKNEAFALCSSFSVNFSFVFCPPCATHLCHKSIVQRLCLLVVFVHLSPSTRDVAFGQLKYSLSHLCFNHPFLLADYLLICTTSTALLNYLWQPIPTLAYYILLQFRRGTCSTQVTRPVQNSRMFVFVHIVDCTFAMLHA